VGAMETKGDDRRARRVQSQASIEAKRGLLRCPVCFLVQGVPLRGFSCALARCPRKFVAHIEPPSGGLQSAGARDEPFFRCLRRGGKALAAGREE
jgi:hypothetical protein